MSYTGTGSQCLNHIPHVCKKIVEVRDTIQFVELLNKI